MYSSIGQNGGKWRDLGRGLEKFCSALRPPYQLPPFLKFLPTPLLSIHNLMSNSDVLS